MILTASDRIREYVLAIFGYTSFPHDERPTGRNFIRDHVGRRGSWTKCGEDT